MFSNEITRSCISKALIKEQRGALRITSSGLSHLKRLLHPDMPFTAQQGELVQKTALEYSHLVNESESPLGRLYSRKDTNGKAWLNEPEFRAGEQLRKDFERAGLQPRITANWEASVAAGARGAGVGDISDFAMDARQRFSSAIDAIGPELAGAVIDVCCFLKGLETVERERSWPARSAKLMLRTALRLMVRHYGLVGRKKSGPISHWGANDFRPQISSQ